MLVFEASGRLRALSMPTADNQELVGQAHEGSVRRRGGEVPRGNGFRDEGRRQFTTSEVATGGAPGE